MLNMFNVNISLHTLGCCHHWRLTNHILLRWRPPRGHLIASITLQSAPGWHLPLRHSILPQELEATETWPLLLAVTKAVRRGPFRRDFPSAPSLLDNFSTPPSLLVCTFSAHVTYPLFAMTNKPRNDVCPLVHSELKVSTGIS